MLYELGQVNFELHDATAAIGYFGRALALDPESTEIKLAYADANIKRDDFEKIQLKGKLQKIIVYEVTGIKDRWTDPKVIPPAVAAKYRPAESFIEVPEDVVLPIEALDGAVGHCRVVALLSYAIADRLGLNEAMKKTIMRAGYLQNLGKEAVPHHILNSPEEPDRPGVQAHREVRARKAWPLAAAWVMSIPQLLDIVLHHHEAWDGRGYPDRLKGEAIPLGARITAVAEAYSALTSWRPYHEAWDSRVAMNEIRNDVDRGRFDPKVVATLNEVFRAG